MSDEQPSDHKNSHIAFEYSSPKLPSDDQGFLTGVTVSIADEDVLREQIRVIFTTADAAKRNAELSSSLMNRRLTAALRDLALGRTDTEEVEQPNQPTTPKKATAARKKAKPRVTSKSVSPPLQGLGRITDLIPSPRTRKTLRKMLNDQKAGILDLQKQGRPKSAKWIAISTWGLWAWYVLRSPFAIALAAAIKRMAS